jgi:cell division protein FtsW (lipid II flippase)
VRFVLRVEDRAARLLAGLKPEPVTGYTAAVAAAKIPDARLASLGLLFMSIGLGVLWVLRSTAVAGALGAIFVAMLAWIGVEYLRPQRPGREPSMTPAEVLKAEPGDGDWARRTAIIIAACGVPLSVIARQLAVFATATLLVLYIAAMLLWRLRRTLRRTADSGPRLRLGAPLLTLVLLGALTFVALVRRLDGPTLLFAALFFLFLLIVRNGRDAGASFALGKRPAALAVLGIPLAATLLATRADFGLGLVFSMPLVVTLLLAMGLAYLPRGVAATFGVMIALIAALAEPVLRPHLGALEHADTPAARSAAFADLGGPLRHWKLTEDPVVRAVVRGLSATHPELLERVLVSAGPSPAREEILRSMEQAWGGRAYAASGLLGEGLAGPTVIGRGVPVPISYAENTFSVYVLSEHGLLGGIAVLLLYVWMALTVALYAWRLAGREKGDAGSGASGEGRGARGEISGEESARPASLVPHPASRAPVDDGALPIVVGGALMLTIPAAYVAASNLGIVPLTGQNMPFLGLNAWSDTMFVGAMVSAMVVALWRANDGRRSDT